MCFNYKVSLLTFFIGLVGSISLIKYGNPKFKKENYVFGIFFIFIAFVQFMDFIFWIDLKNKYGMNKIMTLLGMLLIAGQPIILYILKLILLNSKKIIWNLPSLIVLILNILYFVYLMISYYNFITNGSLITGTKHGHLSWPWTKYTNGLFYLFLLPINIIYLTNFTYSSVLFIITYICLYLSYKYFNYNIGELWCFFGAFIPFVMLGVTYLLN